MAELLDDLARALAGRFRLERELGRGGMAIVFLAHDLRHDRPVALKVLTPELAHALGPGRFLREIAVSARLTHPHVLPLLDSGEACGLPWYTMPYVEGETLRARLVRERQLPLEESLRIAGEVGDALDHAHRQGVAHRDVKPENVLFAAGHAVLADFGVARAVEQSGGERLTASGVVLGTPAYLSPEQAAGGAGDARSDQYALACVVYEMLAGQPPFTAAGVESLLHQHLNVSPRPVTELRPATPAAVADVLARALAKNPADRFPDTRRFVEALASCAPTPAPGMVRATSAGRRRGRVLAAVGAIALIALAAALAWRHWSGGTPPPRAPLRKLTFDDGLTAECAISRDGRLVAYVSDRDCPEGLDLWVQQATGSAPPLRLTHDLPAETSPSFSPDGARIAYRSSARGGGIDVVSSLGGPARRIADRGQSPRFSPDGALVSFVEDSPFLPDEGRRMFLVPAGGGTPRPFQPGFVATSALLWSPDGRHLLFAGMRAGRPGTRDWWVAPVAGGAPEAIGAMRILAPLRPFGVLLPVLFLRDHVVFAFGHTTEGVDLYRLRVRPGARRASGPVEQLTGTPGIKTGVSMAADGTTVFAELAWQLQIQELPLRADGLAAAGPSQVTSDLGPKFGLSLSADGRSLSYTSFRTPATGFELRLRDLVRGRDSLVLSLPAPWHPWSSWLAPAGAGIALPDSTGRHVLLVRPDRSAPEVLCAGCDPLGFLPSGELLVREGPSRLARLDPRSGAERDLLRLATGRVLDADVSARGDRGVVLVGRPDRGLAIYTFPLSRGAAGERDLVPVLEEAGWCASPRWSRDGRRVYFLSDRDGVLCIWTRRVDAAGQPAGAVEPLLHAHRTDLCFVGPRENWALNVGPDRMVFTAARIRANVWAASLDPR